MDNIMQIHTLFPIAAPIVATVRAIVSCVQCGVLLWKLYQWGALLLKWYRRWLRRNTQL